MPIYEYKCLNECNGIVNKQRSITESDPGYLCETCNVQL
jgi:putative FmdB family regulatory protein